MAIEKITETVKQEIGQATNLIIPDSPTGRGWGPGAIKDALEKPLSDVSNKIIDEIDRVAREADTYIAKVESDVSALNGDLNDISAREDAREKTRDERETAAKKALDETLEQMQDEFSEGLSGKLDRVAGDCFAVYGESPSGAKLYPLEDETCGEYSVVQRDRYGRICAASPVSTSPDAAVINKGYLEGALQKVNEAIKDGDNALRGAVAGKTASFVIEDAEMLEALLSGAWSVGGSSFDASVLNTGDNVFIIDVDLPDLWFEATDDSDRVAETVTVKDADGAERKIVLDVKGYQTGSRVGLLHILEGAKHVDVSADLDGLAYIDKVLDYTIVMQEALINGKTDAGDSPVRIGDYYFQIEDGSFWEDYLKGDTMFTKDGEYVKVKSLYSKNNKVFVVNEDGDRVKSYDAIVPFGSYALMMDGQEFVIFSIDGLMFIAKRNMYWGTFLESDYDYAQVTVHGFYLYLEDDYPEAYYVYLRGNGNRIRAAVFLPGTTTKIKNTDKIIGGAQYPRSEYIKF
jgi:hypothetical protein